MPCLDFPFFLATVRHGEFAIPSEDGTEYIAAFSSVEKATHFMAAAGYLNCLIRLVSRPTFSDTIDSLRTLGSVGFCFDPTVDGDAGRISFEQIALKY